MGSVEWSRSQRSMAARSYVWPVWATSTGSRITSCRLTPSQWLDRDKSRPQGRGYSQNRRCPRPEAGCLCGHEGASARRAAPGAGWRGPSPKPTTPAPGPARHHGHCQPPPAHCGSRARGCRSCPLGSQQHMSAAPTRLRLRKSDPVERAMSLKWGGYAGMNGGAGGGPG